MNQFTINTQLSLEDFRKLNIYLLYRNWAVKFLTGVGVLIIVGSIISFLGAPEGSAQSIADTLSAVLFGAVFVFLSPASAFFNAKRNYNNARISERIVYEFNSQSIKLLGESFNTEFSWDKLFKVTETKDWVLLWQNKQMVNALPKKDMSTEELEALYKLIKCQKGLKHKLTKE